MILARSDTAEVLALRVLINAISMLMILCHVDKAITNEKRRFVYLDELSIDFLPRLLFTIGFDLFARVYVSRLLQSLLSVLFYSFVHLPLLSFDR